ncbi:MAG: hypothetical protein ABIF40_00830 [archaeon]
MADKFFEQKALLDRVYSAIESSAIVGQGENSIVYRITNHIVAKVYNPEVDKHLIENEYEIGLMLKEHGFSVPEIYGLEDFEDLGWVSFMEKITGKSLLRASIKTRVFVDYLVKQELNKARKLGFVPSKIKSSDVIYNYDIENDKPFKITLIDFMEWRYEAPRPKFPNWFPRLTALMQNEK